MLTPAQVKAALERAATDPPAQWEILTSLIVNIFEEHAKTREGARVLAKETKEIGEFFTQLKSQIAGAAGTAAAESEEDAAEAKTAIEIPEMPMATRVDPSLPADLQAANAEMDAAIAADAMEKRQAAMAAAAAARAPKLKRPVGKPMPRATAPAAPVVGNGTPMTDEERQAALEAQMESAAGPRPQG